MGNASSLKCRAKICAASHEMVPVSVNSEIKYTRFPFSKGEVVALKLSWKQIKLHWIDICVLAFGRWFKTYPEIMVQFGFDYSKLTITEVLSTSIIAIHVEKLKLLIDSVIEEFEHKTELIEKLVNLGRWHHGKGVQEKYATALALNFHYALCETLKYQDLTTESAWNSFFQYLMDFVKLGIRLSGAEDKVKIMEKSATS